MKKQATGTPPDKTTTTEAEHKLEQKIDSMSDEEVQAMNAYNPVVRAVTSSQTLNKNISGIDLDIFASITTLGK